MIEQIVLNYLKDKLKISVYTEEQTTKEVEYIVVSKTGGNERNHIGYATVAIQSYSNTKYNASVLNERVKEAMRKITELDSISKQNLNSDYDFTNPTKKQYRYQAVYDLVFYF